MKEMKIEKKILKSNKVDELLDLNADSHFSYERIDEGIRCYGPLILSGHYLSDHVKKTFEETLQMDILAPKNKLNGEPFMVLVNKVQGYIEDGVIVELELAISGIGEESPIEEKQEVDATGIEVFEDLFEDENSVYVSTRLIVAKPGDTYEAIASRYEVDVEDLRRVNKDKEVLAKMLVMLP